MQTQATIVQGEIGGEFPLLDFPQGPSDPWAASCRFFVSGRAALIALYRHWSKVYSRARLLVPGYFCFEVVGCLRAIGVPMVFYEDDPQRKGPDFDSLPVLPHDMVLAVNYFGVRSGDGWSAWRDANPNIALIEDHTHDPQSTWARCSTADFAFASLRKTIPVPDGAITWSPRDRSLPEATQNGFGIASSFKLAAMLYKRRYLDSGEALPELKSAFRKLQQRGEGEFSEMSGEAISPWSLGLVGCGSPSGWRRHREHNVRLLLALAPHVAHGEPLFTSWPSGHCPFNGLYVFQNEAARERARRRLIASQVYTPVHWPLEHGLKAAVHLSKRILTVPVDFRCNDEQIRQIASLLAEREVAENIGDE